MKPPFSLTSSLDLYYLAFPGDRIINKALVYSIYFMETVQAIFLLTVGIDRYSYSEETGSYGAYTIIAALDWTAIPFLGGFGTVSQLNFQFSS